MFLVVAKGRIYHGLATLIRPNNIQTILDVGHYVSLRIRALLHRLNYETTVQCAASTREGRRVIIIGTGREA